MNELETRFKYVLALFHEILCEKQRHQTTS